MMFSDTTPEAQKLWWMDSARMALKQLDKPSAKLEWVSYTHHAVFKVIEAHEVYILKLALKQHEKQLRDEYHLLRILSDAGLAVTTPFHLIDTDAVIGMLGSYLEGKSPTGDTVADEQMMAIGAFLAQFHQIALTQQDVKKSLLWEGLYAEDGVYYPTEDNLAIFSDEHLQVLNDVTTTVKQVMQKLSQESDEVGVIHADLLLKNTLFNQDKLYVLDFEYSSWGYYLYDFAPLLWQLKPQAHYTQLEDALWRGYTQHRALSEMHYERLETLIAGRQVASLYWVAENQDNPYIADKVEVIVKQRIAELANFLMTGELNRE